MRLKNRLDAVNKELDEIRKERDALKLKLQKAEEKLRQAKAIEESKTTEDDVKQALRNAIVRAANNNTIRAPWMPFDAGGASTEDVSNLVSAYKEFNRK